jgi:hypothetical protein
MWFNCKIDFDQEPELNPGALALAPIDQWYKYEGHNRRTILKMTEREIEGKEKRGPPGQEKESNKTRS